jgi:CHAT domain-containing protein
MNHMIQVFRQRLQDPQSDPLSQAQLLYHCLIAPLDDELSRAGASTLLISLDDTLRYLPFAALHDGTRYLCERYRIVVYTAAARRHLATPPGSSWKVAGLGVSEASGSGFRPLPGVRGELDSIIREEGTVDQTGVFPGVVHLDNRFTSSQLRADLNAGYPVVHIASHFKFQPGSKTDSFLLLGDGQRLSFDDFQIEEFRFSSVDLLTLSACETAFGGRDAHGREIESFGVLAQQLGAKAVLATLWQVEDMSTAEFMANFYRYRQKGLSKIEALQEAQLAFIREPGGPLAAQNRAVQDRGAVPVGPIAGRQIPPAGPPYSHPYSHPYYWAPFILMGNFL